MKEWQVQFLEFYRLLLPNWANPIHKEKWEALMNQIYAQTPKSTNYDYTTMIHSIEDKIWFDKVVESMLITEDVIEFGAIDQLSLKELRGFILYEQFQSIRLRQENRTLIITEDTTKPKREKITMTITKAEAEVLYNYITYQKLLPDLLYTLYDEILEEFPEFKKERTTKMVK